MITIKFKLKKIVELHEMSEQDYLISPNILLSLQ